jgi:site-specific recombinase XerD
MKQLKTAFYMLPSKLNKKGEAPVYLRLTYKSQEVNLSTSIYLKPDDWDRQKLKVKTKHASSRRLNLQMKELEDRVYKILDDISSKSVAISLKEIKLLLKGKGNKIATLLSLTDYFINHIKHNPNYSKGRVDHYRSFRNKMICFLSHKYCSLDFDLEKLNYEFMIEWESFLGAQYGNIVNTITSNAKRLKAIVNTGIKLGWVKADPFKDYKCKFEPTSRQFLNHEEVKRIQLLTLPENKNVCIVRDVFLFMIYTGISYGDLHKVTESNIINIDGHSLLNFERGKTNGESKILLLPQATSLIKKYEDFPTCKNSEILLPVPSNKTMNDNLKIIAKEAGITKNLSCHIGRHTFATLSLEDGVPIETLSKCLGHSSIKTTQLYGKVTETKICRDYSKISNVFNY